MKSSHIEERAGVSNATVRTIEGGRVPGVDTLERLARVLRISPAWLAYAPLRAEPAPMPPIEEGAPLFCASLGARLRSLRENRGLTKRAMGEAAGISGQAVTDIEEGRAFPGVDTAEQLAGGLGVSPAWLAYGEGPQVLPKVPRRRKVVKDGPPRRVAAGKGRGAMKSRKSTPPPAERRRRGPAKGAAPAARSGPAKSAGTRAKGPGAGSRRSGPPGAAKRGGPGERAKGTRPGPAKRSGPAGGRATGPAKGSATPRPGRKRTRPAR